jgi:hypothetical protein
MKWKSGEFYYDREYPALWAESGIIGSTGKTNKEDQA